MLAFFPRKTACGNEANNANPHEHGDYTSEHEFNPQPDHAGIIRFLKIRKQYLTNQANKRRKS